MIFEKAPENSSNVSFYSPEILKRNIQNDVQRQTGIFFKSKQPFRLKQKLVKQKDIFTPHGSKWGERKI